MPKCWVVVLFRLATSVRQARDNQTVLGPTDPCIECRRFLMRSGHEWANSTEWRII